MVLAMVLIGIGLALLSLIGPFLMIGLMPNNLGLAGGLGTAGPTIGLIFWSNLSVFLLNSENSKPNIEIQEGTRTVWYFSENVAEKTPNLFFVTCVIVTIMAIVIPPF